MNEDKCIALSNDGNPPAQPTAKRLWGNSKYHNGFIVRGFLSTYDVPAEESPVAFPIGTDQYVEEFLTGRTKSIESLLTAMTQTANIASPSLPIRQAMNCLLRACITQKCGRLLRALPPDRTTNFSIQVDEKLIRATQDIF